MIGHRLWRRCFLSAVLCSKNYNPKYTSTGVAWWSSFGFNVSHMFLNYWNHLITLSGSNDVRIFRFALHHYCQQDDLYYKPFFYLKLWVGTSWLEITVGHHLWNKNSLPQVMSDGYFKPCALRNIWFLVVVF